MSRTLLFLPLANCPACFWKTLGEGKHRGHCYMFRDPPTEKHCGQFRPRPVSKEPHHAAVRP